MLAIIDGAEPSARRVFSRPRRVICATTAADVPAALEAIAREQAAGFHLAGWLAYELGYALEPRLRPLMPPLFKGPLLKLGVFDAPATQAPAAQGRAWAGAMQPEWSEAQYTPRFDRVRAYIEAGDLYQANLSFRARFRFVGDALAFYERLRQASQAPCCAYVDDGERRIVSLSPELFFSCSADGRITARPMKGTLSRQDDDEAGRAVLAASAKDRAENLMIVDLIRNDLGRIAVTGSVKVSRMFEVETYPTLHTMVSTVSATMQPSSGPADIIRALFPCGSVTGAPKIRAMEVLRELEISPRGVYCGAIGWFAPDGSAHFNVAIRTLAIAANTGELGIGGGVVHDSRAAGEYAECLVKARFFERARRPLALIETLKYAGDDQEFVRLDSHLARMAASAAVFGYPFDAARARHALHAAVAGTRGTQRVRLTLDEHGAYQAAAAPLGENPACWTYRISPERVSSHDEIGRHKTTWRALYEREAARLTGNGTTADEVIFLNERGEVAEGARSNVFVRRDGRLLTPPLDAGVLDGRLRAELIASGKAVEHTLMPADLAGEIYLGNSLRGLICARPA
jgi:para-aminobenzoate synthetase/4-amino-4-deoxychorismate lyase